MPRRVRPKFPEAWHVPNDPEMWITWEHVNEKLAGETVYWVSTASRLGHPHAVPVWGIWKQNRFYFETDPKSVKGRNLLDNQSLVVHVQDGNDTVILEGKAQKEDRSEKLNELKNDYAKKYQYTPDWSNDRPQIVFQSRTEDRSRLEGPSDAQEPREVHLLRSPIPQIA